MRKSSFKLRSLFIVNAYVLATTFTQAAIEKVSSMQEVRSKFESVHPEHTLGIFDLDLVLTIPKNPALQEKNLKLHSEIYQKIMDSLTPLEKDYAGNMKNTVSGSYLVEKGTPLIIKDLQKKGIKFIGLTATMCGRLGQVQCLEEKRYQELLDFGIDFSDSFKEIGTAVFSNLNRFNHCYPAFRSGILYSNGEQSKNKKGTVLIELLKKTRSKHKTVIFVDDKLSNLQSVEESLKQYDPTIQYLGLEYTGAEKFPSPQIDSQTFLQTWETLRQQAKELCSNHQLRS